MLRHTAAEVQYDTRKLLREAQEGARSGLCSPPAALSPHTARLLATSTNLILRQISDAHLGAKPPPAPTTPTPH